MFLKSVKNQENKNKILKITKSAFIYRLVCLAVYLAFFLIAGVTIFLGYIPFGPTALTYLPLVVAVATLHLGFWGCITAGIGFGFSSFIAAFLVGALKYQNFDIAVLSRVSMSLVVYLFYLILNIKKNPKLWKFIILVLIATEFNVIFVLSSQYFHHYFIGELKGILPPLEWIITHPVNLIAEPIFNTLVGMALFLPILELNKKYIQKIKMSW